ncbi:PGF-pre-PGF domain-containing protein [Candidatus Woesearchaeota archaeon]|nr:PGF-pre-PGF domain-containing protein [Candidatus Woesearchaeota archaeon]
MDAKKRVDFILQYKLFWACLAIILIIPVVGVITTQSGVSYGERSVQKISYAPAGTQLRFEVKVDGVKDMTFTFTGDIKNEIITIEEIPKVSWPFTGEAYSRFRITADKAVELRIGKIDISLKIKEDDLLKSHVAVGDVRVYHDGQELETAYLKKESGYVYYQTATKGFGEFLIGKRVIKEDKPAVAAAPEEKTVESPIVAETPEATAEVQQPVPPSLTGKTIETQPTGSWARINVWFKGLFK